jgi:hypothetical protein
MTAANRRNDPAWLCDQVLDLAGHVAYGPSDLDRGALSSYLRAISMGEPWREVMRGARRWRR